MADARERAGVGQQIPRLSLALLMLAQAASVVPHGAHLSLWIIGVGLACAYWRWMVFQGRWAFPARWVKACLVAAAIVGVALDRASPFSLETATALLIVAFALKLVEMRSRRDAYLVTFLCYFVIATEFLFDQTIGIALYETVAIVVVTAAMVGLNQMHARIRPIDSLKTAAVLVLQALPLMLVLFVFFPRIVPLWSVPLPGGGHTGITDRVNPGDIAELARSDEIALRVDFEGAMPASRDLYWRGLVYSDYDAGVWSVGAPLARRDESTHVALEHGSIRPISYEVLQEPNLETWLFALETPEPQSDGVQLTRDYRLVAREPLHALYRFRARSFLGLQTDLTLSDSARRRALALPDGDNPRARAFAAHLHMAEPEPVRYLAAVLRTIRTEPYRYTLKPPRLESNDPIDEFWFDTRAGFCSHFAGAFVYLARLAGIPARMVGGYQGGEVNPVTGHLVVRQYDAHAWTEVWLDGRGWVRYDPTAAVAPERIERGLEAALSAPDREALATFTSLRLGAGAIANALYYLESVEHRWNLWVVGYDGDMQHRYVRDLMGDVSPVRIGLAMLLGGAASLGLVALTLFWRRRPPPGNPVERAFRRFTERVGRSGVKRAPSETPTAYLTRVLAASGRRSSQADPLVEEIEQLLYNPPAAGAGAALRRLERALRRLNMDVALRARG